MLLKLPVPSLSKRTAALKPHRNLPRANDQVGLTVAVHIRGDNRRHIRITEP